MTTLSPTVSVMSARPVTRCTVQLAQVHASTVIRTLDTEQSIAVLPERITCGGDSQTNSWACAESMANKPEGALQLSDGSDSSKVSQVLICTMKRTDSIKEESASD
jgi:hypothetical protein